MSPKGTNTAQNQADVQGEQTNLSPFELRDRIEKAEAVSNIYTIRGKARQTLEGRRVIMGSPEEMIEQDYHPALFENDNLTALDIGENVVLADLETKEGMINALRLLEDIAKERPGTVEAIQKVTRNIAEIVHVLYKNDETETALTSLAQTIGLSEDEVAHYEDADEMLDELIDLGDISVAIDLSSEEETLNTLEIIDKTLCETTLSAEQADALSALIHRISDKYSEHPQIENYVQHIFLYVSHYRTALVIKQEPGAYSSLEEKMAKQREAEERQKEREIQARIVKQSYLKGDFPAAYQAAVHAAEDYPEHFLIPAALFAKHCEKYGEALKLLQKAQDVFSQTNIPTNDRKRQSEKIAEQTAIIKNLVNQLENYKNLIKESYEAGNIEAALHITEEASKKFPYRTVNLLMGLREKLRIMQEEEKAEAERQAVVNEKQDTLIQSELESTPEAQNMIRVTFDQPSAILEDIYYFASGNPEMLMRQLVHIREQISDAKEITEADYNALTKLMDRVIEKYPDDKTISTLVADIRKMSVPEMDADKLGALLEEDKRDKTAENKASSPLPQPKKPKSETLREDSFENTLEALREDPKFQKLQRMIYLLRGSRHKHPELDAMRADTFHTTEIHKIRELFEQTNPLLYQQMMSRDVADLFDDNGVKAEACLSLLAMDTDDANESLVRMTMENILRILDRIAEGARKDWEPPTLAELTKNKADDLINPDMSGDIVLQPDIPRPDEMKSANSEAGPTDELDITTHPLSQAPDLSAFAPEAPLFASRTKCPAELMGAIEMAVTSDSERLRLLDLWEVVNGKAVLEEAELNEQTLKIMQQAQTHLANGRTERAVNRLKACLQNAGNIRINAIGEGVLAAQELRNFINRALDKNPELRERFEVIFDILEVNPNDHAENAEYLLAIQKDIRALLFINIPETAELGNVSTMQEILSKLTEAGLMQSRKKLRSLTDILLNDEDLNELIADYREIVGANSGTSTTPAPAAQPTPAVSPATPTGASNIPTGTPGTVVSPAPSVTPSQPTEEWTLGSIPSQSGINAGANSEKNKTAPTVAEKRLRTAQMLAKLGFRPEDKRPAVLAIYQLLASKKDFEVDFDQLEDFLRNLELTDEVDKLARESEETLREQEAELKAEMDTLDDQIRAERQKFRDYSSRKDVQIPENDIFGGDPVDVNVEKARQSREQLKEHNKQKEILRGKHRNYQLALQRKAQNQTKETMRYDNPEQLLGMINLYFETNRAKAKGETPDHIKVLERTQMQIEKAQKGQAGIWHRARNELLGGFFKPTLTGTLQLIAEKDQALKRIKPEQMELLAKQWNDSGGVESWITGLEGTMRDKMERIVPVILGHLDVAINTGRLTSSLNTFSLNRAKGLANKLRRSIHEYSLSEAKKNPGKGIQKMNAYFGQMNTINGNVTKVSRKIVRGNLHKRYAQAGLVAASSVGIGAGALAVASLSAIPAAAVGAGALTTTAGYSSLRVKDPETKAALRRGAIRTLGAGAVLGGTAALGLAALPAAALAAPAIFAPEFWKNKKEIKGAAQKYGWPATKGVAGTGWALFGVALSGITFGLAMANPKYRKFFGMS